MSSIKHLSVSGLKDLNKVFDLAPLTWVFGPNKSNKTSLIDAIKVAILGYYPAPMVPKTNDGTFKLASAPVMSIALRFSDNRTISRTYSSPDWVKVKSEQTPKDYVPDPRLALCLDHSLYFSKSEAERVQQIFNLSEGKGDVGRVPAIMARLKLLRATDHDQVAERVLGALLIGGMPQYAKGGPVQTWLADVLEWAKETYKSTNAQMKAFDATNQTLSEANAIDALANTQSLDELKVRQAELKEKHDRMISAWSQSRTRAQHIIELVTRKDKLAERILAARAVAPTKEQIEELDTQIRGAKNEADSYEEQAIMARARAAQIMANTLPYEENLKKLHEIIKENTGLITYTERQISLTNSNPLTSAKKQSLTGEKARIEGILSSIAEERGAIKAKLDRINSMSECEVCHNVDPDWKSSAIDFYNHQIETIDERMAANKAVLKSVSDGLIAEMENLGRQREKEILALENVCSDLRTKNAEAVPAVEQLKAKIAEIKDLAEKELAEEKRLTKESKAASARWDNLRQKSDELDTEAGRLLTVEDQMKEFPEIPPMPSVDAPDGLQQVKLDLFEVESMITTYESQQAERKRIDQIMTTGKEYRAKLELVKLIGETVKDEQAKIVAGAFGPVLSLANRLVLGILPTPLVYHEGQVGRMHEKTGRFVSVATFSGSEQRMTFTAITAALAQQASDRIAIIDEIGTFDSKSQDILLENVRGVLASKDLDQVIIVGTQIPELVTADVWVIST